MRKKKALGQHFLHEKHYLRRIAECCPVEDREVIEIGAGTGNLTEYLARKAKGVYAVEKDEEAFEILKSKKIPGVVPVHDDILELDLNFFHEGVAAGNLPYYISSPIIRKFLALREKFTAGCFLLQKEVALRMIARSGRQVTPLSLLLQNYYEGSLKFIIPPGAFSPPPKVESSFIVLIRRPSPLFNVPLNKFEKFLRIAFSNRRKTLFNNLRNVYREEVLNFPRNLRVEEMELSEFVRIFSDIMVYNEEKS